MRPAWTIWRHTLVELWRQLLVATSVLVLVVSFAATSKYFIDGKIGPGAALRFTLYAIPPMLQYALPFSACFATVLTYHRMATDNELIAARAGGLSYRRLLLPAAASGVVLTLFMGVLGEQVIPRFLRRMQATISQDVATIIRASVDDGRPIDLRGVHGGAFVHADAAQDFPPDPASGAYAGLLLLHPVALQVNAEGAVESATTASRAWVWLYRSVDDRTREEGTLVNMRLENASGSSAGRMRGSGDAGFQQFISGSFNDSPKYMTFSELRALPREPERSNVVDRARRELAVRLARERVVGWLDESLRTQGRARFTDSDERVYTIHAAGIRAGESEGSWRLIAGAARGAKVEIEMAMPGGERGGTPDARVMLAESAVLRHDVEAERARGQISMTLSLTGVTVRTRDRATSTGLPDRLVPSLLPTTSPLPDLLRMDSDALLNEARARVQGPGQGGPIAEAAGELERRIAGLMREVDAKAHERMAIAATCIVMVIFGAIAAMRLERKLPLVVYAWCFFPALVAVLSVNVGQNMAISSGLPGLVVVWSGLAALSAVALFSYRKLARN